MGWSVEEAVGYYKKQGAPGDQSALIALLREAQGEAGGSIPKGLVAEMARLLGVKDALLLALIKRIPSLRLGDGHTLELCAGPNCGKAAALAALAEDLCRGNPGVTLKFVPCMRLCGKGPNLRFDGLLHHRADEALLRKLLESGGGK